MWQGNRRSSSGEPIRLGKAQPWEMAARLMKISPERRSLLSDIACLDALDAGVAHLLPGVGQRAVEVDGARGVLDDVGREAELARIERGPGDAEVGGKPGHEHRLDAALLQVTGQSRHGLAVGLDEGRVAVDVLV